MESKEIYYKALIENNGQLNEIDLGEKIGLDENETREIIAQLLFEHKIKHEESRVCDYSLMKIQKKKQVNKT